MAYLKRALAGGASALVMAVAAHAAEFNIPGGDLATALDTYTKQSGIALLYPADAVRGTQTRGAKGEFPADVALARILTGTGFTMRRDPSGLVGIVKDTPVRQHSELAPVTDVRLASTDHAAASVETVVVTSSKIKGDIQTVPIAITALSQEQLTSRQIAGGPDLVKEVPNLTFTKTNFSGYSIQIRGIGTQAISVTTDPAVAVALNDMPFIRNHFFEQEFFDVNQVEVLRGPQGTLYGRNATAGVVNVITAKPTDQFEAMLSADWGNYTNRRYEGMVNIPIVDDRLDLRVAGEWTKRDGYSFNTLTN
ncbi:MAG TPA: TonB-dependent receptor plug domain-containing protein, partial [Rhizomicrobium sp.]|nr:TonB-dependent receptor plug domain-containing protein [Rhizomicrobium sp.]